MSLFILTGSLSSENVEQYLFVMTDIWQVKCVLEHADKFQRVGGIAREA